MRYALLGTTVLCGFALATYACGTDSNNSTIPTPDAGGSSTSSTTSSSGSTTSSSSSGASGSSTSSSSSGSSGSTSGQVTPDDAGKVGDASDIPDSGGPVPDGDTAFDGSAGSKCQLNSIQEAEDNGTPGTANTIPGKTGTFCGSLSSPTDVDYVKFTLPADAVSLDISTAGGSYTLTASVDGGAEFPLTGAGAGAFTFKAGGTYTLHVVSTATTGRADYIIGVDIKEQTVASKCAADSTMEIEPNDTDAKATSVPVTAGKASWCGVVTATSDVDEFTFKMPTGYTHLSTNYSASGAAGTFHVSASHNGTAIPDPSSIPIVANDVYIFKFTSDSANNAYVYNLTLTP